MKCFHKTPVFCCLIYCGDRAGCRVFCMPGKPFAIEACLQTEFMFLNEHVCFSSWQLCSETQVVVGVMFLTHLDTVGMQ